jgi:ornithine cyclodeaminase/alanine dehydrogenase-like protein (mu-crystallin family)
LLTRGNVERVLSGLLTIQGMLALRDAADGSLLASTVGVDLIEQCSAIGDLHHAIAAGLMTRADVHAELGQIIAGTKPGRTSDDEIIVFDSSGTALQDVAAAAAVYRRAAGQQQGVHFSFHA